MSHNTAVCGGFIPKPHAMQIYRRRSGGFHGAGLACDKIFFHSGSQKMLLSKEYVGYLAREITKRLISGATIKTRDEGAVRERVHAALLDEMGVEDRINDEVRMILEAYSEEMRRSGANYQEMFKKVKNELARKYKAVL
jgi:hypothetical protein